MGIGVFGSPAQFPIAEQTYFVCLCSRLNRLVPIEGLGGGGKEVAIFRNKFLCHSLALLQR